MINKSDIENYLLDEMCKLGFDKDSITKFDHLLSSDIGLPARELALLVLNAQTNYNIMVSDKSILSGKLSTINGISEEVYFQLKKVKFI